MNSCRYALMNFALDLHRRVATGTARELIDACRHLDNIAGAAEKLISLTIP